MSEADTAMFSFFLCRCSNVFIFIFIFNKIPPAGFFVLVEISVRTSRTHFAPSPERRRRPRRNPGAGGVGVFSPPFFFLDCFLRSCERIFLRKKFPEPAWRSSVRPPTARKLNTYSYIGKNLQLITRIGSGQGAWRRCVCVCMRVCVCARGARAFCACVTALRPRRPPMGLPRPRRRRRWASLGTSFGACPTSPGF